MRLLRLGALVALLVVLALIGMGTADLVFDRGRFVAAALGRDALLKDCSASLAGQLAEKGFEPTDLDFDLQPNVDLPWRSVRSIEGRFTFLDGPQATRVDGVMACAVSVGGTTVDFRVASTPHRNA